MTDTYEPSHYVIQNNTGEYLCKSGAFVKALDYNSVLDLDTTCRFLYNEEIMKHARTMRPVEGDGTYGPIIMGAILPATPANLLRK